MDRVVEDTKPEVIPLPVLRDDLEIVPSAPLSNGAPAWVIFDPVSNRYFEIGREILDMLILWRVGTVDKLIRQLRVEFGRIVKDEEVVDAIHFLMSNALLRDIPNGDYKLMAEKQAEQKKSWFSRGMHGYLFFRIPLFRPDRFLRATWPVVAPLFTKTAVFLYALMGCFGLYVVSRQWDHFTGTFQFMLSWQGAILYGLSLVFVKSLHELGHAFMAVRYGLRVPTIGVAFMVLMPVLYTDTSSAWRLRKRSQRLMIDGAGIFTEFALASLATLLWAFLPEGGFRLCVFAVATTSWITSLLVNLNPLMRFDGYYLLADTLGFQNLQQRGFEMARWRLREVLFGLGDPAPEVLSPGLRRTIVLHAWATWIYRFFLFLGIALLVYAFFIKIVGIVLFLVEIIWFILLPVWREMKHWWSIRDKIMKTKRFAATSAAGIALVILGIIPWSTQITVPAVMTADQEQRVFAPFPAQVMDVAMRDGQAVAKGDVLMTLVAPQLDLDLTLAQETERLLVSRIGRSGSDIQERASLLVLQNELSEVRERIEGLRRLASELVVRAPLDGRVTDIDHELHAGIWIDAKTPLAIVQSTGAPRIKGYVAETSVFRFGPGAEARFIPDNPSLPGVNSTVSTIAETSTKKLDEPYLALPYGGTIAVEEQSRQELRPINAAYAVAMKPTGDEVVSVPQKAVRGVSVIKGAPESIYSRVKRQVLRVFVREMGV